MTKIDIFSGFLGAGKTTLIKKLIAEGYRGEKLILIENEFGEIGIDGGFLKEAGIQITEMNSGCICCSLVGDFGRALRKVQEEYHPDRILIEPSGVGKLSDVIRAVESAGLEDAELSGYTVVVDAKKCRMYMKNFGEFFNDQVEHAGAIVLSRTGGMSDAKIAECVALLREHNAEAVIVTTPWEELSGEALLSAISRKNTLSALLERLRSEAEAARLEEEEEEHHHHHHHEEDEEHECCHHHHEEDEEHECCHHHHDDDEEHEYCHHHHDEDEEHECCHHHHEEDEEHECCHHHHEEDEEHECCHHHHDEEEEHEHEEACTCGCHDGHHHHHHADEVFTSFGVETARAYTPEELEKILEELEGGEYGIILRAKGIVRATEGEWIHFDYVPGEPDIRRGCADVTGRLCVIGSGLQEDKISALFGL